MDHRYRVIATTRLRLPPAFDARRHCGRANRPYGVETFFGWFRTGSYGRCRSPRRVPRLAIIMLPIRHSSVAPRQRSAFFCMREMYSNLNVDIFFICRDLTDYLRWRSVIPRLLVAASGSFVYPYSLLAYKFLRESENKVHRDYGFQMSKKAHLSIDKNVSVSIMVSRKKQTPTPMHPHFPLPGHTRPHSHPFEDALLRQIIEVEMDLCSDRHARAGISRAEIVERIVRTISPKISAELVDHSLVPDHVVAMIRDSIRALLPS